MAFKQNSFTKLHFPKMMFRNVGTGKCDYLNKCFKLNTFKLIHLFLWGCKCGLTLKVNKFSLTLFINTMFCCERRNLKAKNTERKKKVF